MFSDRRKSERHQFNRFARIQGEAGGAAGDCLIINMSETGVRLHSDSFNVPDDFILVLSDGPYSRRSCKVVWRLGFEIGAEFTTRMVEPRLSASPNRAA
jgi:PilZ domain